jgi:hypothetical protein
MIAKKIVALQASGGAAAEGDHGGGGGDKDAAGAEEGAPVLDGAYKHPKLVVTEIMRGHNIQFATFNVRAACPLPYALYYDGIVSLSACCRTWAARRASC